MSLKVDANSAILEFIFQTEKLRLQEISDLKNNIPDVPENANVGNNFPADKFAAITRNLETRRETVFN